MRALVARMNLRWRFLAAAAGAGAISACAKQLPDQSAFRVDGASAALDMAAHERPQRHMIMRTELLHDGLLANESPHDAVPGAKPMMLVDSDGRAAEANFQHRHSSDSLEKPKRIVRKHRSRHSSSGSAAKGSQRKAREPLNRLSTAIHPVRHDSDWTASVVQNSDDCKDKNDQCKEDWVNDAKCASEAWWRGQCPKKCGECTDDSKDASKDDSKDASKDDSKDASKDGSKDASNDGSKDDKQDDSKDGSSQADCSANAPDLITGNDDCCTSSRPCDAGEGDCDADSDCNTGLTCGKDNCPWGDGDDCCQVAIPPPPTDPGCYVVTPSGCPQQASVDHKTWTKDDYDGASSNKARCEQRKGEYDTWCGSSDAQVVFVPTSSQTGGGGGGVTDGLTCSKDTGGTCNAFECKSSRLSECVDGKCVCGLGQCAKNGKCVQADGCHPSCASSSLPWSRKCGSGTESGWNCEKCAECSQKFLRYDTSCYTWGDDDLSRDSYCSGDLVCARNGQDGRNFGDCPNEHCCSKVPESTYSSEGDDTCYAMAYCLSGCNLNSKRGARGPYAFNDGNWQNTANCIDTIHIYGGCTYEVATGTNGNGAKTTFETNSCMKGGNGPGYDKVRSIRLILPVVPTPAPTPDPTPAPPDCSSVTCAVSKHNRESITCTDGTDCGVSDCCVEIMCSDWTGSCSGNVENILNFDVSVCNVSACGSECCRPKVTIAATQSQQSQDEISSDDTAAKDAATASSDKAAKKPQHSNVALIGAGAAVSCLLVGGGLAYYMSQQDKKSKAAGHAERACSQCQGAGVFETGETCDWCGGSGKEYQEGQEGWDDGKGWEPGNWENEGGQWEQEEANQMQYQPLSEGR